MSSQVGVVAGSEYRILYEVRFRSLFELDSDYKIGSRVSYYFSRTQIGLNSKSSSIFLTLFLSLSSSILNDYRSSFVKYLQLLNPFSYLCFEFYSSRHAHSSIKTFAFPLLLFCYYDQTKSPTLRSIE